MRRGTYVSLVMGAIVLVGAATARGQWKCNDFEYVLFGRTWRVQSFHVQDDLANHPHDTQFLRPKGLACRAGLLYASGDRGPYRSDGRLARYQYTAAGELAYDGYVQMPNTGDEAWGPNGLAFNTSGTGYGAADGQLVSVERDAPDEAGVIDLNSGAITDRRPVVSPEGIAFLPAPGLFAVVQEQIGGTQLQYYSNTMAQVAAGFALAPGSKGIAAISAEFASFLTVSDQSEELLVVATCENPDNALVVYDTDGNQIGPRHDLPVEPKARIPLGGGFYEVLPAFGRVEAIAVDEDAQVIFVGDAGNAMVHVWTPLPYDILYMLTVHGGGGAGNYASGTIVEIYADEPAEGEVFDAWTGDTAYVADVTAASTTVTMPESHVTVTATYASAAIPGDLNGDGFVGQADLDIILANWGQYVDPDHPAYPATPEDNKGFVGQAALDVVLANWGRGTLP